jgi:NADH:ubiquinone oxidoreductase subunit 4 (subunit M)
VLTWLILLPVLGAVVVGLTPRARKELHLPLAIAVSVLPLALALYVFTVFEPVAGYQFTEFQAWY